MGAVYLGVSAVGWHNMLDSWWDKLLAAFILASVILGSLYILFRVSRKLMKQWRTRHEQIGVPARIQRYIDHLKSRSESLGLPRSSSEKPKSFGVFLGSFDNPPTVAQLNILSQWDTVVLDPLQDGVLDALSTRQRSQMHILGRLDLKTLVDYDCSSSNDQVIRTVSILAQTITKCFQNCKAEQSPFTGVVLAGFTAHFNPLVLNEIAKYINGLGFDLWLEMAESSYPTETQCRQIDMQLIQGIIYRNGTIRPDGDRQNFFQMAEMRTAMRAVAAQRVPHGPLMTLWETIEDPAEFQHAAVQRCFKWCRYNSALCWVGRSNALRNAEAALSSTMTENPLGALMWLKSDEIMKSHGIWRENEQISQFSCHSDKTFDSLQSFIPDLSEKLRLMPPAIDEYTENDSYTSNYLDCGLQIVESAHLDPLSQASSGADFTGLGCFHLGLEVNPKDFVDLVQAQRHLKDLGLLLPIAEEELGDIADQIRLIQDAHESKAITFDISLAAKELVELLTISKGSTPHIEVYIGLHSGFQTSTDVQFWGLYDVDSNTGDLTLFISAKAQDRASAILHTLLSSKGFTRAECFAAELVMSEQKQCLSNTWHLPPRLVADLEQLSPQEMISFQRRLMQSKRVDDSFFLEKLRLCCDYLLIDAPTITQLREANSVGYLTGDISAETMIKNRIAWFHEQGCWLPDPLKAVALFGEVDARLRDVLMDGQTEILDQISLVIQKTLQTGQIDSAADIFALSVFCAFRKLALNEVYLEILDRNPYPNHSTDQAACFAENFALGSRCESFFDMTSRSLGRIIAERYRVYYMENQPPSREDQFTELPTTYAAMEIDSDPHQEQGTQAWYYRVTFLSIFALPAFIDVMLLTTIGRGLYLTTFMSTDDKTMATAALMLALLTCGGFGSWITSGGSYYLDASAFPAMNMFVLTRFVAGIAVVIVGGLGGAVGIIVTKGFEAGLVFLFYFSMLTTYLLTLSALSIYQLPGTSFQSGRTIIAICIPILFISPIVTLWFQHDRAVYLSVLTFFLTMVLLGARRTISRWGTWYLSIPLITDSEVVDWYTAQQDSASSRVALMKDVEDIEMTPWPRRELQSAVLKERQRHFWTKSTTDPLVAKLARGYSSTMFLMRWFCKLKRTKMPLPYSTTWNLTLKAGVDNITNMQKGLKLHSAFLHWRHTGADIWSGILYFIVALLDKWAALVTGGYLVGLSAANSEDYRFAVGFGLCYYLIGAVCLDTVLQPLRTAANQKCDDPINSIESLRQADINDARARRVLYWKYFAKFFSLQVWGIAFTAALMWAFDASEEATIMYLAYVGAYTGLLWYQYNKIYCGYNGARCLGLAAIVGLPTGIALDLCLPDFPFGGVLALALATWIAGFYSMWVANIGWPVFFKSRSNGEENSEKGIDLKEAQTSYFSSSNDPYPEDTQESLSRLFASACAVPPNLRYTLDPFEQSGHQVVQLLLSQSKSPKSKSLQKAFPFAETMLSRTIGLWRTEATVVELVSFCDLIHDHKIRSISQMKDGRLHVCVLLGQDLSSDEWTMNTSRYIHTITEALVQASFEAQHGLPHDHSLLAGLLVSNHHEGGELCLPEGVRHNLETSTAERTRIIVNGNKTLLRYLLFGLDCESEWSRLPRTVRALLLRRCEEQFCGLSADEETWIRTRFGVNGNTEIKEYIARCNLGVTYISSMIRFASAYKESSAPPETLAAYLEHHSHSPNMTLSTSRLDALKFRLYGFHQTVKICIKFLCVALTADPEYQRELNYMTRTMPLALHWSITFFLNSIWMFSKALQWCILPLFLYYGRETISQLHSHMKGMKMVLGKRKISIESLNGPSTCFISIQSDHTVRLLQYAGHHKHEPSEQEQPIAINTYTDKLVLREREEYRGQNLINHFTYDYPQGKTHLNSKLPVQRQCLRGNLQGQIVQYDDKGYITTGSFLRDVNAVQFRYWYRKSAKHEDNLLRGEFILAHITIKVSWSIPPRNLKHLDDWIPFSKVTEATFVQGSEIYHSSWNYDHKFHPEISTTLNGKSVPTPPMIQYDWFQVLQKPEKCGFLSDNPLLSFSSTKSNVVSRLVGLNIKRYPISTANARSHLWKIWKDGRELDAVTARWLDEGLLRSDRILTPYWRNRDIGRLDAAKDYLDEKADAIMARVDVTPDVSSWVHIAFKISDLYSFGQGGDSRINTRTLSTQLRDCNDELHILAMDTSTWPYEPGGVSACRRDMVNDLSTIRWHIVAETGHDFGIPRFQIEQNVQSLAVLPLWGLDFLNPTHGILQNSLDSAVVRKSYDTRTTDIEKNFLPILTSLVRCARTLHMTRKHINEATNALVDLNTYFESSRNWNDVWSSDIVKQTWRKLWLTEDMEDTLPVSKWWNFEYPTITQLDLALDMWHRYLFVFSIPLPERVPDVFQASHHFTGATYGILCKIKRHCSLHVWDHGISFRECTVFMSSAVSFETPFVNNSLMSLNHLGCVLLEHHADVVLPCAEYFNPGWEVELGTAEGALQHRQTFARKVDPVVNGICNMENFEPIKSIKAKTPTAVMLSHIFYLKDIKNAIMAADVIVNKWGFTEYRLHIYGDMARAAALSTECQELIASKCLRDHCVLKGVGNADAVLQEAWLFLNSSMSEGLPLALGEAALTGVPVVCTDVGASFCVVTDRKSGDRFSEVVAPNDAESLARAQLNILGMLGKWSDFAEDDPGTSPPELSYPNPTPEQVQQITQRMYQKTEQRRRLGMLGRDNVLNNFSSERYLREHEQMLWIGKFRSPNYHIRSTNRRNSDNSGSSFSKEITAFGSAWSSPREKSLLTPRSGGSLSDELYFQPARHQYVLVTGGLGFIGSHTSLELLKAGYNVIIVDDLSNSFRDVFDRILAVAKQHFETHGGKCPKAQLCNVNYRDQTAVRRILESHCVATDYPQGHHRSSDIIGVIHFAAFKAVEESIRQPLKYYENNVNGLVEFMTLLKEYNIKTFIFSSSATVYGTLADGSRLLREEDCVHTEETYENTDGSKIKAQPGSVGITNPYGRTKFFGEAILSDLAASEPSWKILGLRYFNPVGCDVSGLLGEDPKGTPSNLLPVVVKVVTGEYKELSVFGSDWDTPDGSAIRDFIHVTDLARGHIAALSAAQEGRIQGGYRTFNLGTGTGYSVLEVVAAMEAISGRSIPRKVVGRRAGDVQSSVAAADRARNELGWQTTESLNNACRDTWNHLRLTGGQVSEITDTEEEEIKPDAQAMAVDLEKQ